MTFRMGTRLGIPLAVATLAMGTSAERGAVGEGSVAGAHAPRA